MDSALSNDDVGEPGYSLTAVMVPLPYAGTRPSSEPQSDRPVNKTDRGRPFKGTGGGRAAVRGLYAFAYVLLFWETVGGLGLIVGYRTRIDVLESSRRIEVEVGGVTPSC